MTNIIKRKEVFAITFSATWNVPANNSDDAMSIVEQAVKEIEAILKKYNIEIEKGEQVN